MRIMVARWRARAWRRGVRSRGTSLFGTRRGRVISSCVTGSATGEGSRWEGAPLKRGGRQEGAPLKRGGRQILWQSAVEAVKRGNRSQRQVLPNLQLLVPSGLSAVQKMGQNRLVSGFPLSCLGSLSGSECRAIAW